jgi:ABC-2 type transport system ATP-binding protein
VKYNGNIDLNTLENMGFSILDKNNGSLHLQLGQNHTPNELLKILISQGTEIHHFNEVLPGLNEIFIKQVELNNE